ncbi:MAG: serine hydrolase, partial [Minisyncoccia bacterium]
MHDSNSHSFDSRGFLFALGALALVIMLGAGVKYGSAFAHERFARESESALAAAAQAEAELTTLQNKHAMEREEAVRKARPSRFVMNGAPPPKTTARSYVVGDVASTVIFAHKKAVETFPIASLTKLLTALVARETFPPSQTIELTEPDRRATGGYPGSILRDETFKLEDSFRALLTESNNSIAYALERTGGGEKFMEAMRAKAKEVGMDATTLEDPSGISANNAASALDVMVLIQHLYDAAPDLLEIARKSGAAITAESGRTYRPGNYNVFSSDPHFIGGKTGYTTEARQTYASIFEVEIEGETALIAIAVLGSDNRKADTEALLK